MIIHTGGRANGKTVRLIMTAAATKSPVITSTNIQAKIVRELSVKIGYPVEAYSIEEFRKMEGHDFKHVAIDELNKVLEDILGVEVVASSIYGMTDDMANCPPKGDD